MEECEKCGAPWDALKDTACPQLECPLRVKAKEDPRKGTRQHRRANRMKNSDKREADRKFRADKHALKALTRQLVVRGFPTWMSQLPVNGQLAGFGTAASGYVVGCQRIAERVLQVGEED